MLNRRRPPSCRPRLRRDHSAAMTAATAGRMAATATTIGVAATATTIGVTAAATTTIGVRWRRRRAPRMRRRRVRGPRGRRVRRPRRRAPRMRRRRTPALLRRRAPALLWLAPRLLLRRGVRRPRHADLLLRPAERLLRRAD